MPGIVLPPHHTLSASGWDWSQVGLARYFAGFKFDDRLALAPMLVPTATCLAYLLMVWSVKRVMRDKKPFDLKQLVTVYNFTLSVLSGLLFFVLGRELLATWSRSSFTDVFCDPHIRNTSGALIAFYYMNYVFKYIELADTLFLCLRKKHTPFIHVYHHAITLFLCWTQLTAQTCMQWVIIEINLGVHILLYCYYGLYEMKVDIWWKKYLTTIQIVQFLVGLSASIGAMLMRVVWMVVPLSWGWGAPCHGNWSGSYFGLAVVVSYLVLFMRLYNEKYKPAGGAGSVPMAHSSKVTPAAAKPLPDFQGTSTFSPLCQPIPPTTATTATPLSINVSATQEDVYAAMRATWLSDPLIVADKARWARRALHHQECVEIKPEAVLTRRVFSSSAARL